MTFARRGLPNAYNIIYYILPIGRFFDLIGKFKLLFQTIFYLFDQRKYTYSVFLRVILYTYSDF